MAHAGVRANEERGMRRQARAAGFGTARLGLVSAVVLASSLSCATGGRPGESGSRRPVAPGITVLLEDSIHLVKGKRVGLITNQTGIDRDRVSDIDLLSGSPSARKAAVTLVALYSPEHGIRGTEDHHNVASERDEKTGLPVYSLYGATTVPPPDSTLVGVEVLVFDLQDIGTRTWTYVGTMLYAMRAASRHHLPFVVLDRPNPLTGDRADGPLLDSALANPEDDAPPPGRRAQAYALYPFPLRHGMTMGEMARYYNDVLQLGADLHVIPVRGWRRTMWFDQTGLPWVRPSPNLPSLTSSLLYPALVAFEGSNLSVGRGTPEAFQRLGAPWLNARAVAELLNDHGFAGVRFEAERFTPHNATDRKYSEVEVPGVRIVVTNRNAVQTGRIGAGLLWAIARTTPDSVRINTRSFDLRMGAPRVREALMRGEDPDAVLDREMPAVIAFRERVRKYNIY